MTSTEGGAHQQTVMDALQQSPAAPFLNMPLPQLPAMPTMGSLPQLPALPQLPPMPPNPLDAILSGQGLPALPGLDQLMKPITDLASGFGSGNLGAFDPTQIFQQSSGMIDTAMQMGQGGLKLLDQFWQGNAAQNVQTQGQQAQGNGEEISQRGTDISSVTQNAAASVSRGNAKLTAIAESFATTAIAAAPVLFTPPGQAMLMASAAEHLTQAVAVVTETRAELTGHTAQMAGLSDQVPVATAPNANPAAGGGQSPFAMASQVLDSAKPMMSTVTDSVGQLVDGMGSTHAASADLSDGGLSSIAGSTHAAGLGHAAGGLGGGGGSVGGGGGGGGAAGIPMFGGGAAAAAAPLSAPSLGGGSATGGAGSLTSGTASSQSSTSTAAAGVTGATGMGGGGMMGGMGRGMGGGGGDDLERTSPSYLTDAVNNSDVVGDMPKVVSPVLGADDPEEFIADFD